MQKTLIITLLCAMSALPVLAQEPTPAPSATPAAAQCKHHRGAMRAAWQSLTPEERQKLKAARQVAKNDPAVAGLKGTLKSDRKAFHQALRTAMLKADPSVAPILEKLKAARKECPKAQ